MNSSYIGLDPSFTGFGISIINEPLKTIFFIDLHKDIDKHSTIKKFDAITELANDVTTYLNFYTCNAHIGQEVSTAYTGWFIAELYALDYNVFKCVSQLVQPLSYDLFSQTYITTTTGHKSSLKEKTIFLIEDQILPIFKKYGYKIDKQSTAMTKTDVKEGRSYIKRETITNNSADSFIYALREFIKYSNDEELKNEILKVLPKLSIDNKELK